MLWRAAAELRLEAEAELLERAGCDLRFLTGLAVIEEIPGLSQVEIARRIGMDRTTVADLLADYLAEGLIERGEPGRGLDRRSAAIEITDAGRRCLQELRADLRQVERRFLARLQRDEVRELGRLIRKLEPPDRTSLVTWIASRM